MVMNIIQLVSSYWKTGEIGKKIHNITTVNVTHLCFSRTAAVSSNSGSHVGAPPPAVRLLGVLGVVTQLVPR